MWRLGVLVVSLAVANAAQAQSSRSAPSCRANRHGAELITKIEYPDGYVIEGPWRVTAQIIKPGLPSSLTAVLDHIVEIRPPSRAQEVTPLPGAIEMTFRGKSVDDALNDAARVWCETVIRARLTPLPGQGDGWAPLHRIML